MRGFMRGGLRKLLRLRGEKFELGVSNPWWIALLCLASVFGSIGVAFFCFPVSMGISAGPQGRLYRARVR